MNGIVIAGRKKEWKIVIDYSEVNEKTLDDRCPIPNLTDVLGKLGRCVYFSISALASGFHQIEMELEDILKIAFVVESGFYKYVRISFGLKNAYAKILEVLCTQITSPITKHLYKTHG